MSGIRVGFRPSGVLHIAFSEASRERLRTRVSLQKGLGLAADFLDREAVLRLEPALNPALLGAALFPDDASVDNRLLMRALSMAAARAGVRFVSGHVRALLEAAGRAAGVDVDGARLQGDAVVVAAGAWTGLVPGSGVSPRQVRPARGQMVMLRARLPLLERVAFSDQGYLVPRADGHLLAGSTLEFEGFAKEVTAAGLKHILSLALELLPGLASLPVVESWAGLRPFTEDQLPGAGAWSPARPVPRQRTFPQRHSSCARHGRASGSGRARTHTVAVARAVPVEPTRNNLKGPLPWSRLDPLGCRRPVVKAKEPP